MRIFGFVAILIWLGMVPAAAEPVAPPPLDEYGDLPAIEDMAMSPYGDRFAVAGRFKGQRRILVLGPDKKALAILNIEDVKLRSLDWAGQDLLLVTTSATGDLPFGFTAFMTEYWGTTILNIATGEQERVFENQRRIADSVWETNGIRKIDGEWFGYFGGIEYTLSSTRTDYVFDHGRPHLYAVDLAKNSARKIAQSAPEEYYRDWLVNERGEVAVTLDLNSKTGRWDISNAGSDEIASGLSPEGRVALHCFGTDGGSVIYSIDDGVSDDRRFFEVALAGGAPKEIFQDIGFEKLYVDPRNDRLLGYLEDGPNNRPVLFDPEKQKVFSKVLQAFSKLDVRVANWTPDLSHLLVHVSGNGDSGTWYRVDMSRMRADPMGYDRMKILPKQVGPISTIEYAASDGTNLDGILTLPPGREPRNLPVIMLPHGGPHSHDKEQFDWWAQAFASRGYAVFQPNFRGSTNRNAAFKRAGYGQWGRKMQTDVSDGLAELAKRGIVDGKRACIMGASYGGYAALAGVTVQDGIYRCAVSVADVSDLKKMYTTDLRESGDNRMTKRMLVNSLGKTSDMEAVSPRRLAERVSVPILLIHGKDDTVVPFEHSKVMADALQDHGKPFEFVELEGEDHWLSRPETRKRMLSESMRFVMRHNPPD